MDNIERMIEAIYEELVKANETLDSINEALWDEEPEEDIQ